VVWVLTYAVYVSSIFRGQEFLLARCCFFLGSSLVVFSGFSKEKVVLWVSGFIIAGVILGLSGAHWLVLLTLTYPIEALGILASLTIVFVFLYLQYYLPNKQSLDTPSSPAEVFSYSRTTFSNQTVIGGVELVQISDQHHHQTPNGTNLFSISFVG